MQKFLQDNFSIYSISTIKCDSNYTKKLSKDTELSVTQHLQTPSRIFRTTNISKYTENTIANKLDEWFTSSIIHASPWWNQNQTSYHSSILFQDPRKDVSYYFTGCRICWPTKSGNENPFGLLHLIEPIVTKWSVLIMGFTGPLYVTKKGHRSML